MTMLAWLRSLANAFLGRTGKPDRVDTATRMAMDANFSGKGEPTPPEHEPAPPPVDPLAELVRLINEQQPELKPRPKPPTFSRRRRSGRTGA